MNSKKIILLSCVMPCVFAVSPATAQMRGHGASMAVIPMHRAPMVASAARMPMQRAPILHSPSGFHRFKDGDFDRDDRFRRINRVIVIDNFAFPFFASFPYYYPYPYPYPYYGYPYGAYDSYGYGADYGGYGASGSLVVQVQRRLANAGYYSWPGGVVIGRGPWRADRHFPRSP